MLSKNLNTYSGENDSSIHWSKPKLNLAEAKSLAELNEDGLTAYEMLDYAAAMESWLAAAERGSAQAQYKIGILYDFGEGVEQDYIQAAEWYRLAAQDQYAPAQFSIGEIHMRQNNTQGYQQAMKWYFLAAENGYAPAQFNLGEMFANGIGIVKDYPTALKWYHLAAQQANPYAQASLGRLYEERRGVPQDFALAHMWFNLSTANGFNFAQTERDNLAQKMPPTQIAEAQAIARDYAKNYLKNKT